MSNKKYINDIINDSSELTDDSSSEIYSKSDDDDFIYKIRARGINKQNNKRKHHHLH